ncbi:MAG: amidase family protein [Sandaracinus sp.]
MSIARAYDTHDALGLAELVRKKEVSATELLDEAIARSERLHPRLNAVVIRMHELARAQIARGLPEGPFTGVPMLLKDLASAYAGVPLRGASKLYEHFVPAEHGELVRRYLAAGVVVFGKTNTSEWGILPTTESTLYGPCHNPWKHGHTVGGSSGGAGAVVAARIVPVAHGGDAGGSIRIPASACGVFGLKPTRGRNPMGPDGSERAHGLAAEHVLSLTVRDSAAFLDASAGPEDVAPYWAPPKTTSYLEETRREPGKLRIAYTTRPILPATLDPEVVRATEDAAKLCASLGHDVVEAHPPVHASDTARAFFTLYCSAVGGEFALVTRERGRMPRADEVEPTTRIMGMIGTRILSAGELSAAIRELQATARAVHRFHRQYDVLLAPTLGRPPVAHGVLGPQGFERLLQDRVSRHGLAALLRIPGILDRAIARAYNFAPSTPIANVTGQPSMSVPLWWSADGLPIGTCFTARFGDEASLFRLAAQLEAARPWRQRVPPASAAGA